MKLFTVTMASPFLCFLITLTAANNNPNRFTGDVSVNCGSSGTSAASSGREWTGDVQPKLLQVKGSSTISTVSRKLISAVDPVPHKTARISRSRFSYAFQVSPGQKIIRLHFNPSPYKGFKGFKDLFTVEAGPFTLLSNFSASLTAGALGVSSFAKEFCLNIRENQHLNITFAPETSQSLDMYAFINGIEIISVPASLSYIQGGDFGLQVVGQKSLVYVDHNSALEIIHRQKIKQNSDDMFPKWATEKGKNIKSSSTWKIPVDVGFRYLIRLHFSEVGLKIAGTGDVMFKVLINEMIAHTNTAIMKGNNGNSVALFEDYMVIMRGHRQEGKRDLLISLQSNDELIDGHEVLAGFEILKLSNPDNNLASPNPLPPYQGSRSQTIQILLSFLGHRNAFATAAIIIISMVNITIHISREIWEASRTEDQIKPSDRAKRICRHFSLNEIQVATRNFSDALVIGRGGFGRVYKGLTDNGQHTVAIKRLKSSSRQGAREFLMEIETLSELRHVNLVSLIGYCNEHREMILVYDYMCQGTLADHLYKTENNNSSLTWKQRLNICIGAARGLDYLHTGHGVIHRDVKSSNVLLDENFVAKVSDFGLAKPEDKNKLQSHVSTKVKGTPGYWDPYYLNTSKLTRKSDTYAFGVVLLEVLCGRSAVDYGVPEDERVLSRWARDKINKGEVDQIVASSLREEILPDSLKTFVSVADRSLHDDPKHRPTMSQVVQQLDLALEQQDTKQLDLALDQQDIKQPSTLNEITIASDDTPHGSDEEFPPSINTRQPRMGSAEEQNFTSPPTAQNDGRLVNTELPSGSKHGRKSTANKPPRLWQWNAFWNRAKPSKKNDSLLSENLGEMYEVDIRSSKFDWGTIASATNQFSSSNKVGEGGFGSVYKAVLPTGQVVAVKRMSPSSTQDLSEFKNVILMLPNLQHRNIIKLIGYCIHRDEKLLLYEYMENRSLNMYILDERRGLEWPVRLKIITGIARGVVYLHQDSGLKVMYRNLKPSNILLDMEMNPKISDFAFARTLVEDRSELVTMRIAGTFGYMSPEYAMEGKFSMKSDVYSFGIIVLEIVSGKRMRNTEPILDYAWNLWKENAALYLVDDLLGVEFPADEALRCIQVGLLCVQHQPHSRPTMPSVLKMLEGDETLPEPQEPWSRAPTEFSAPGNVHDSDSDATFELDESLAR